VAVLDNIMYVVCRGSSTIRLYNMDTHSPLDVVINVKGMNDPLDIVVCRDDRQLYVADDPHPLSLIGLTMALFTDWHHCIWRVSVDDYWRVSVVSRLLGFNRSCVKWLSIDSTDTFDKDTLSVTSRRLLVTSRRSGRLCQYSTTDRQLLRVVKLPQYVRSVHHGVETTRGTFVVGHEGTS